VARVGADQIQVGIPGATSVGKATDCATKPARLFFYDWEPNLIGIEHQVGGTPGTTNQAALAKLSKIWTAAGRNPTSTLNQQLVGSGALPTEWDAAQLAAQQKPVPNCSDCSQGATYYFFSKDKSHRLIDGPETVRSDLFVSPNGRKRPENSGIVVKVPEGTVVVSQVPSDSNGLAQTDATPGWYAIKDHPAVSGTQITNPKQGYDSQTSQPNVTFGLSGDGNSKFQDVTRRIAERGLANAIPGQSSAALSGSFAIVLDNEVKSRPIVDFNQNPQGIDPSRGGVQVTGLQLGEAQQLTDFLQRGALPIDLKVISQSQVSATLGKQALNEGLRAGVAGVIIVVLFLLLFYRFLGLVASIALGAYGVIFFALIKLIPVTLTLPGIAGLVLTIGVAADSNIVIFERIKEEVRSGRSMPASIAAGYRRGIATIVDANVVTLLTAFILFVLATAGVKGFALTLALGTITSLLTAVVFTQALLGTMSHSRLLRSPAALGASGKQRVRWHFDFMGASRWFFSMSGTILIVGSIALATKQLNLGIDFQIRNPSRGRPAARDRRERGPQRAERGRDLHRGGPAREWQRGIGIECVSDPEQDPAAGAHKDASTDAGEGLRHPHERVRQHQRRPDVRDDGGEQRPKRVDLLAAGDLRLRCASLPAEVRPTGPDRAVPRHPDHGRGLCADGEGGDQRDDRRLPHHPRVLVIRHDHRLRSHPREPAADAARRLLADRQPVDERGADTIARNQLLDPAPGAGAAAVRRHDPEGLRLRAAGRDRLRDVLVDIHRLAGAERLEGARARLPCPPRAHRGRDGHSAAVRRGGPGREAGRGGGGG